MGTYYAVVGTREPISTPFTLPAKDKQCVVTVEVPSLAVGGAVQLQFTNVGSPAWIPLQRPDGSGLPFFVHSGTGPALVTLPQLPSLTGRFVSFSATVATTYTIYTQRPVTR